jgi:hypothetical protein
MPEYIEINSRDFLAALMRMVALNSEHFAAHFEEPHTTEDISNSCYKLFFEEFSITNIKSKLMLRDSHLCRGYTGETSFYHSVVSEEFST